MKKIYSIIAAGVLALLAFSCTREEMAVFDASKATAPVLSEYQVTDDGVTATFTPAVLNHSFNQKMALNHWLMLTSVNGQPVSQALTTSVKENTLIVTQANLSKALMAMGFEEGDKVAIEMVIRASMQEPSKDNGRNGYIDSDGKISIPEFEIFLPTGDPYARYTEKSEWGLVGSFNGWGSDPDVEMWTNGTLHVAKGVTLAAGDEVKFRKNASWDENFGYADGVSSYTLGEEFAVGQGGANIVIAEDGRYDLLLDPVAGTAKIINSVAGQEDPYAAYTEVSPWSVIGSFNSWAGDVEMVTNGTLHVCKKIALAAGDEFKFRKDASWDVNFGYADGVSSYTLGEEFAVGQGGANIIIAEDGEYDLFLDPENATAKIIKTQAVVIDPYASYTEESPWSVIGSFNSWGGDVAMVSNGTLHVCKAIALNAGDEWKFRKDADWAVNFGYAEGVSSYTLGEEFAVGQDGANIIVAEDGVYDFILDPENATAKVIASIAVEQPEPPAPVEKPTAWSLIGTLNGTGWDTDFDLTNTSGDTWVIRNVAVTATDEFKIRADHDWAKSVGGPEENSTSTIDPTNPYGVYKPVLGEAFEAKDKNIQIGVAGNYDVTFDYAAMTILIEEHNAVYSLIGEINGDSWKVDVEMTENNGVWTSPVVEVSGGFKIRYDYSWADESTYGVAEGFTPVVGTPFTAVQPGGNISVEPGKYKVQFTPATKEVLITAVNFPEQLYMIGEEFGGWDWNSTGVVEMTPVVHNPDWGANAEGQFWAVRYISAGKGFKFNSERKWGGDFWGLSENDGFTEAGGNCTVDKDGIYMIHVDFKNEKVHVEPARVYGIGACFGGWTTAMEGALFQADGKVLKATTQDGGEIRMYVESAIATSDWWTREFVFFDNMIDYRGDDPGQGDQARVSVLKGQTVTLDFNAGTAMVTGEGQASDKPKAWSLIGTLDGSSWDKDFDLSNTSGDTWVIRNVAVTANDEFKIRADHDWTKSVGGPEENSTSTISADNPYGVFKPTLGTAFTAGDKNIQIGVEGAYDITFDFAANTILIEQHADYPAHLYMIGEEFGGWNWESDGVVEMTPVLHNPDWGANAPGQFWTVRYFHAGKGFKYCAKRAWEGDFWGLQENDGFTEAGGNCTVAEDGFYLVHIDMKNGKVHVEPARVYGIGDAFGGWDKAMESAKFTAADGKLTATVANTANLRMYVESSIATSDWWTREFNVIDGKITPRIMDELAAVPATAGQKVTLDFNAGTGVIE